MHRLHNSAGTMTPGRLLRLACALVLWAGAPVAAWGGPAAAKVFPLTPARTLPPSLEDAPDRLTGVVAKLASAEVSDDSIKDAAGAARCSIDDSTCLDQIARTGRVKELVFGTIRVGDDQRVFVKLTRYIAGTERREKTFVLTAGTPAALARQLSRVAREMFELPPLDDESGGKAGAARDPDAEPARPRRRPARTETVDALNDELGRARDPDAEPSRPPRRRAARTSDELGGDPPTPPVDTEPAAVRRGRVTRGTYLLISGGVMGMAAGTGFAIAGSALNDDLANAKKVTPDDKQRIAAIERAARIRTTTGTILIVSGSLATAGGIVRALLQRRPIDAGADRAVSLVPIAGGAALVLSGRLP
jgi:hypothetical protein